MDSSSFEHDKHILLPNHTDQYDIRSQGNSEYACQRSITCSGHQLIEKSLSTDSSCVNFINNNNIGDRDKPLLLLSSSNSSSKHATSTNSLNGLSLLQESGDLHWFTEDHHIQQHHSSNHIDSDSSKPQSSHHSSEYEAIARDRDANLAQIDMETFKTEDINHLYTLSASEIDNNSSNYGENDGDEYASFTQSLFEEMTSNDHYIGLNARLQLENRANISDCSTLESSLDATSPHFTGHDLFHRSNHSIREANLDVSGVSVDSLDLSSAESSNTHQMVLRCKEHDKSKYKIAFEESGTSIKSDFRDESESQSNRLFNQIRHPGLHFPIETRSKTRKFNRKLSDQMAKSEYSYTTWNQVKKRSTHERNSRRGLSNRLRSGHADYAKKSQSLPEMMHSVYLKTNSFIPLGHYLPLYDLHSKQNANTSSTSNSEISPPRSLIRHFIKNRRSPSSCSPASSSTSFDEHLNDSSDSSPYSPSSRHQRKSFANPSFFQKINHNWSKVYPSNSNDVSQNMQDFEDSLVSDENAHLIPGAFVDRNTQASPITEENELSEVSSTCDEKAYRKEIATETDRFPWAGIGAFSNVRHGSFQPARRSVSVDRFVSPSAAFYNGFLRRNTDTGSTNLTKTRWGREFGSLSSGYHSSRPCLSDSHRNHTQENLNRKYINNVLVVTNKSASTQIPVHIQDKQVQASLSDEGPEGFTCRDYPSYNNNFNYHAFSQDESPPEKPLYVCYPNYSLPDLKFLRNISSKNSPNNDGQQPTTIHLSPTKLDLPLPAHQTAPTITRRNTRKGVRPKSCTEYENMITNRAFNHIKDWDSLKVLLPNELKALISRLEREHPSFKNENNNSKPNEPPENCVKKPCEVSNQELFTGPQGLRRANSSDNSIVRRRSNCSCQRRNRRSLQEPLASQIRRFSNPCTYEFEINALTRSVTMPSCMQQQCDHRFENIIPPANMPCCGGQNHHSKDILDMAPNEDRLCHLFSKNLSLKEFTSILSGQHRTDRLISPSKIYAPIKEQAEESESFVYNNDRAGLDVTKDKMSETIILSDDLQDRNKNSRKAPQTLSVNISNTPPSGTTKAGASAKRPTLANLRSASQPSAAVTTSPAKRPTSLGSSGFRSMIPIAKGNKVSPSGNKIISPNNINLGSFSKKS